MKHLLILPDYTYAGYCSTGGSNKDWAACLAIEGDSQVGSPPIVDETAEVIFLSLHGPHGGHLIADPPKKLAMRQARAHFTKKCREKDGKAYVHVPFLPYLAPFGHPFGLPLIMTTEASQTVDAETSFSPVPERISPSPLAYRSSTVKAMPWDKIQQTLSSPDYGITEKVNGERCILVFDGASITAYNRKGHPMSAPPEGATHLCKLACPWVIDGERLTGNQAGHFVAFDLLEWNNEAFTAFSYIVRITTLQDAMFQAGLLAADRSTPTHIQARANSTEETLTLLVAATGAEHAPFVVEEVQASSGEGVIVRRLSGSYDESPFKFKFVADLDAFVLSVNEGIAEGSLKMGVVRPTDGAVIEIANVRSGLTNADIRAVRRLLEQGERPVFTVVYLPKRTVGIHLVEPRTSMAHLRTDKDAIECTTEQFGPEKAALIAQAKPVAGITLV